ncbi:MAG: YihY/virulence factor BrkB family protein [Actinomycetota bacterium]|nr:YihY/virulence factor BrkB family protein [Actinomycetota bacterium]
MDLLAPVKRFDSYQQKHKPLAIPVAVIKKFGDDQAGGLAALVAYYAFFSLFPLLLVFVTILAYVLQSDPHAQQSINSSVLAQFPIIGKDLGKNIHSLHGHAIALVIGLLTSLLAGLGVTQAAQNAFDRVWAVPFKDRPDFLHSRLRGLGLLASLGLMFIVATLASGLVTGGLGGPLAKVAGILISLLLNFALFLVAFRFMTAKSIATRCLWIGVIVAGVFWEILQVVGGIYIGHVFKHSTDTYGFFGLVIALLVWLHLGAQLTLYSAEINVVLARKLWPRSLFGPPAAPADERTLTALAKVEERSDQQTVEVSFDDGPDREQGDG